jgi:hypothetical protein
MHVPIRTCRGKTKMVQTIWMGISIEETLSKETYGINDFDHFYLDPFNNGTLLQVAIPNDELTTLID